MENAQNTQNTRENLNFHDFRMVLKEMIDRLENLPSSVMLQPANQYDLVSHLYLMMTILKLAVEKERLEAGEKESCPPR